MDILYLPWPVSEIDADPAPAVLLCLARTPPPDPGGRCQWPLWGDGERPTHRYCGAAAASGRSYCAAHCRVAYGRRWRASRATLALAIAAHYDPGQHRTEPLRDDLSLPLCLRGSSGGAGPEDEQ